MTVLGLSQKQTSEPERSTPEKCPRPTQNETSEEAKKIAAAALSAVKEAATAAASSGRGKVVGLACLLMILLRTTSFSFL